MRKKSDPKSILRDARNQPVDGQFLKSLRGDLVNYMALNPAIFPVRRIKPTRLSVSWLFRLGTVGAVALVLATSTVLAAQQSLPGESLYPVKLAAENVRLTTTLGGKQRADLRISFVQERVKEIETVLSQAETRHTPLSSEKLDQALENLTANSNHISDYASKLKSSGDLDAALHVNEILNISVSAFTRNPADANSPAHPADTHALQTIESIKQSTEKEVEDINQEKDLNIQDKISSPKDGSQNNTDGIQNRGLIPPPAKEARQTDASLAEPDKHSGGQPRGNDNPIGFATSSNPQPDTVPRGFETTTSNQIITNLDIAISSSSQERDNSKNATTSLAIATSSTLKENDSAPKTSDNPNTATSSASSSRETTSSSQTVTTLDMVTSSGTAIASSSTTVIPAPLHNETSTESSISGGQKNGSGDHNATVTISSTTSPTDGGSGKDTSGNKQNNTNN